jgi:hypothetical protein
MNEKLSIVIETLNVPKKICDHLLGEEHPQEHRMVVGVFVMTTGVLVANSAHYLDIVIWHIFVDVIGYAIHALGFTPYIEWIILKSKGTLTIETAMEEKEESYPKINLSLIDQKEDK